MLHPGPRSQQGWVENKSADTKADDGREQERINQIYNDFTRQFANGEFTLAEARQALETGIHDDPVNSKALAKFLSDFTPIDMSAETFFNFARNLTYEQLAERDLFDENLRASIKELLKRRLNGRVDESKLEELIDNIFYSPKVSAQRLQHYQKLNIPLNLI